MSWETDRYFFQECIQMAKRYMKRYPTSLIIKQCKSKPQWVITLHLSEWLSWRRQQRASADEEVKRTLIHCWWECKLVQQLQKKKKYEGSWVCPDYILSCFLFNLYEEYITRNFGLDDVQAGIKIAERNINNLRYAGDTTLMAQIEEELKSLFFLLFCFVFFFVF